MRKCFLWTAIVACLSFGNLASSVMGQEVCTKACCTKACLEVTEQDKCLIDDLIKKQAAEADVNDAVIEGLIELQLRLRATPPFVTTKDVTFLAERVTAQKAVLKMLSPGEQRDDAIGTLEELISLHLRAKACTSRTRIGIPPKPCPTKTSLIDAAPKSSGSCCSKAKPAVSEPDCTEVYVEKKTVVQQFIVQDEKPATYQSGGFSVATCQGPINVGPVTIQGGGRESNLYGGTVFESARRMQQQELNVAVDAQRNCRIQTTLPYCFGLRPSCTGAVLRTGPVVRTCTYCTGRGCSHCTGVTRSCVSCRGVGCASCRGTHFHGTSIHRGTGGCSSGTSGGCSSGGYLCGCAGHLENCRVRGLDPRTTPCTCVNCPNAANMVYLSSR